MLEKNIGVFNTVMEIGVGDGRFINYIKEKKWIGINKYIGIDINNEQVEENKLNFNNIEFVCEEIEEWVKRDTSNGGVFISAGTLSYFTSNELKELLGLIKSKYKFVSFGIIEPISFDLNTEFESMPRGNLMYSHNYPFIFKSLGYDIISQSVLTFDEVKKLITMVANSIDIKN